MNKICVVCYTLFASPTCAKLCSDKCRREHQRNYNRRYEQAKDRHEYYRQYHIDHREVRNAKSLARYYANLERLRRLKRERRAMKPRNDPLLIKVAQQWNVKLDVARQWIEQGSFPK